MSVSIETPRYCLNYEKYIFLACDRIFSLQNVIGGGGVVASIFYMSSLCAFLSNIVATDFKFLNCAMFIHIVSLVNNKMTFFNHSYVHVYLF